MKIRDISVRVKLQLGFLAILVLLMGVVVTGQIGMTNMRTRYEDVSRVERVQLLGRTMQAEWSEMARAASIFMATRNANYADDFNRAADSLEAALREAWELIQLETSQATLSTIEANFKRYRSEVADFFRGSDVDRLAMEALREETSQLLAQFVDTGESQAELAAEEASRSAARARTIMWIVAAVASAAGVTIAAFLGRQIATPVTAIAHMASRMAEGDLTVEPLEVRNRDELGELARAFNQMLANMRDVLRRVRTGSEALTDSAKELSAAAESAAQASGGVAQAIAQVAAGATEQAGATQEVDATMEQLKEAIQQIAAGATPRPGRRRGPRRCCTRWQSGWTPWWPTPRRPPTGPAGRWSRRPSGRRSFSGPSTRSSRSPRRWGRPRRASGSWSVTRTRSARSPRSSPPSRIRPTCWP